MQQSNDLSNWQLAYARDGGLCIDQLSIISTAASSQLMLNLEICRRTNRPMEQWRSFVHLRKGSPAEHFRIQNWLAFVCWLGGRLIVGNGSMHQSRANHHDSVFPRTRKLLHSVIGSCCCFGKARKWKEKNNYSIYISNQYCFQRSRCHFHTICKYMLLNCNGEYRTIIIITKKIIQLL